MQSILKEIEKLRGGLPLQAEAAERNCYRVTVKEADGSKTAYCFSSPIRRRRDQALLTLQFLSKENGFFCEGSAAAVTVKDDISLKNEYGECRISLPSPALKRSKHELTCGECRILPTANGVALGFACQKGGAARLSVTADLLLPEIRDNGRYVALMRERLTPFAAFSVLGAFEKGSYAGEARLRCERLSDFRYDLAFTPEGEGSVLWLEANLYEPKLFRDTTVESRNQRNNNAFGTVACLGVTPLFGEEWLYTCPSYQVLSDITRRGIKKALLHLPVWKQGSLPLVMERPERRFCSFGSTWQNKIPAQAHLATSFATADYLSFDLTPFFGKRKRLEEEEGWIIRAQEGERGYTVLSTGDSCYAPQILEIRYF